MGVSPVHLEDSYAGTGTGLLPSSKLDLHPARSTNGSTQNGRHGMPSTKFRHLASVMIVSVASGCATYRAESNINSAPPTASSPSSGVLISEDSLPNRVYKVLGQIEVTVKKLTIFNTDPTKEMVNEALTEKAKAMGADGVVNVTYKSGIGFTSWGYLEAKGDGVKFAK